MYFENRAPVLYTILLLVHHYIVHNTLRLVRSIDSYLDPTLDSGGGLGGIPLAIFEPSQLICSVFYGSGQLDNEIYPGILGKV